MEANEAHKSPLTIEFYDERSEITGGYVVRGCPSAFKCPDCRDRWDKNPAWGRCATCGPARQFWNAVHYADLPSAIRCVEERWTGAPTLDEMREYARSLVSGQSRSRGWSGPTGGGKTWLAGAIAWEACRLGTNVRWLRWPHLVRRMKDAMSGDETTTEMLRPYKGCGLLIVDELGGSPSAWMSETCEYLIGERCETHEPTLITSNLDADALRTLVGDRCWSRISAAMTWRQVFRADARSEEPPFILKHDPNPKMTEPPEPPSSPEERAAVMAEFDKLDALFGGPA